MSTKSKCKKGGKLAKCLKAPLRLLCLANNFYAKALTDCSDQSYGAAFGSPFGRPTYALSRSFSASSSATTTSNRDEDYRELVRAASTRNPSPKNNVEFQKPVGGGGSYYKGEKLPRARSVSVGIRRIDEDMPCDFEDDSKGNKGIDFLPRSKSSAPYKRGGTYRSF